MEMKASTKKKGRTLNASQESDDREFEGRVAIITGGAKGMGGDISLELAKAGAQLSLCARDLDALNAQVDEIRKEVPALEAITLSLDVRDEDQVRGMVEETLKNFGTIDILINTSGVIGPVETPVHEIAVEGLGLRHWREFEGNVPLLQARDPHPDRQEPGQDRQYLRDIGVAGLYQPGIPTPHPSGRSAGSPGP